MGAVNTIPTVAQARQALEVIFGSDLLALEPSAVDAVAADAAATYELYLRSGTLPRPSVEPANHPADVPVLQLHGPLAGRATPFFKAFGGTGLDRVSHRLSEALARRPKAIVL